LAWKSGSSGASSLSAGFGTSRSASTSSSQQKADSLRGGRGLADEYVLDDRRLSVYPWTASEVERWPALTPGQLPDDVAFQLQRRAVERALDDPNSLLRQAGRKMRLRRERRERILSGRAGDRDIAKEVELIELIPFDRDEDRKIIRQAVKP
jgi:hypothetical protein